MNFSGFQPPAGLLDSIFDSMPEQAAILDENGVVQWVNEAWTSFAAANGGDSAATGVGANYFDVVTSAVQAGEARAEELRRGVDDVVNGRRPAFEFDYPCHGPAAQRWNAMAIRPLKPAGEPFYIVIHRNITERKVAEITAADAAADLKRHLGGATEDVAEDNSHLRVILDAVPMFIVYVDRSRRYLAVNSTCEAWYGKPREYIIGKKAEDFLEPPAVSRLVAEFQPALTGDLHEFEERIQYPDGVTRDVAVIYVPKLDAAGEFQGAFVIGRDISVSRRRGQFLDAIVENIPNMVFVKNAEDLRFTLFNRAGEDQLGIPREEMIGKNDYDFFPRDQADFFTEKDREVLGLSEPVDIPEEPLDTQAHGQRILHTKKISIRDSQGRPQFLLGISEDITERKELEQARKESERRLLDFARSSADRFWEMDSDLRFVWFHDPDRPMAAQLPDKIIGKTRWEVAGVDPASDPVWAAHRDELLAREPFREFDYRADVDGGGEIWWRVSGVPTFDDEGTFRGYRGVATDVSELIRFEAERDAALAAMTEANEAKSTFLANMSHELRTPLNSIIGFSQMITEGVFGDLGNAKYTDYLNNISHSARHLLALINDILDLSKVEANKAEIEDSDIEIAAALEASLVVIRPLAEEKSLVVRQHLADGLKALRADERMVHQVLINLMSNAVKFTPDGGTIDINAGIGQQGGIEIKIADTGIGIAEADIPLVLEPFGQVQQDPTRHQQGTGLGLALANKLMELHDGELSIESEVGRGTTVTIRFPKARTA